MDAGWSAMISSLEDFAGPNIFKTAIHQAYKPQTSFPTDRQRRWCGARAWRLQPSARSECRKINSRWGIPTARAIAGAELQSDLLVAIRYP